VKRPGLSVALGYPNHPALAEGNLGFRAVSQLLASRGDIALESFFPSPPGGRVRTRPSGAKLTATDLVLISISYEGDTPQVPAMLDAGGLPPRAADRREGHPLVVGGGALVMINPEPLAAFFDLFLIGEAEAMLEAFLARLHALRGASRQELIGGLESLAFALAPGRRGHRLWVAGPQGLRADRIESIHDEAARDPDEPLQPAPWDGFGSQASGARVGKGTPLGPAYLVELARGCPRSCRFCAASRIYAPLRECPADVILDHVDRRVEPGETVGLLALSAGDYRQMEQLSSSLRRRGLRMAISSLPPTFSRTEAAREFIRSGSRTLTIAPETGSDALRARIGKHLRNDRILESARMLAAAGLRRLRTYFIIGLPGEREEDIAEIGRLLGLLRRELAAGCVLTATVNAFVPKPRTPFQWASMAPEGLLRERARQLRAELPAGVKLRIKSFREARFQALVTRGDVAWGERLVKIGIEGVGLKKLLKEEGWDAAGLTGRVDPNGPLPWEYLLTPPIRRRLEEEWRRHGTVDL